MLALVVSLSAISATTDTRIRGVTGKIGPRGPTPKAGSHSHFDINRKNFGAHNFHEHVVPMSNGKLFRLAYHNVNGINITMGDIVVNPRLIEAARRAEAEVERSATATGLHLLEFDEEKPEDSHPAAVELMGVGLDGAGRWPCPIPYRIPSNFRDPERVTAAIAELEEFTNWRFVQRTNQANYLTFDSSNPDVCASLVGRNPDQRGGQPIFLGEGCSVGAAIHEFMHAIGILHEHTRTDRDAHVEIFRENIGGGSDVERNFDIFEPQTDLTVSYDFGSIMHYGSVDFSVDGASQTIAIRDEFVDTVCGIGQRYEISRGDALALHQMWLNRAPGGAGCPQSEALPVYPECDRQTELSICGRQGRNDFVNGKFYLANTTYVGRPVYLREDRRQPLFLYYMGQDQFDDDGRWSVGGSIGSMNVFAIAAPSDGDTPFEATGWQFCCDDSFPPGFLPADDRVHVATCDFGAFAAAHVLSFSFTTTLLTSSVGFFLSWIN